jgi:hypothetical protein
LSGDVARQIAVKVDEASGRLQREREETERRANEARAEKAKEQHRESNPRAGEKSGRAPHDAPPNPKKVAAKVASEAGVSTRTVERVMKVKREEPEKFEAIVSGAHQRLLLPGFVRGAYGMNSIHLGQRRSSFGSCPRRSANTASTRLASAMTA